MTRPSLVSGLIRCVFWLGPCYFVWRETGFVTAAAIWVTMFAVEFLTFQVAWLRWILAEALREVQKVLDE